MEIAEQFTLTNHESAALVSSGFATATLQQVRETNAGNGAAQDDKLGIPPLFFVEGPQVVPPEHSHPPGEPTSPQGLRELPSGGESPFENRIEQKIESLKAEVLADSYGLKYDAKIVNGRGVYKFYYEGVDGKRVEVASANRLDEAERPLRQIETSAWRGSRRNLV